MDDLGTSVMRAARERAGAAVAPREGPALPAGTDASRLRSGRRALATLAALAAFLLVLTVAAAGAAARPTEEIYVRGKIHTIHTGLAVFLGADQALLDAAKPFYLIGFPVTPGTTGPITLPSGYQPQNNGSPAPIPYHDHVTSALYNPLRQVVEMRYSSAYAASRDFVPLKSVRQLRRAERTGKLDIVDPGAPDPYQHWTSDLLVRPVIYSHHGATDRASSMMRP